MNSARMLMTLALERRRWRQSRGANCCYDADAEGNNEVRRAEVCLLSWSESPWIRDVISFEQFCTGDQAGEHAECRSLVPRVSAEIFWR